VIEPHIEHDLQDLTAIQVALEQDIPVVGMCRGHQLLNILFGGALHQHLKGDRVAADHRERHPITAGSGSLARRVVGARSGASSSHHRAVSRIEAVEVPRGRFALGVQFHLEERQNDGDRRLATPLVDAVAHAA